VQGIYGRRMYETWVQMTALLKAGRLNLDRFLESGPHWTNLKRLHLVASGLAGKFCCTRTAFALSEVCASFCFRIVCSSAR